MNKSGVEWTEYTWNPVTGCTPISDGCKNCYAKSMATRQRGRNGYDQDEPFRVTLREDRLDQPVRKTKGRLVFVVSMGDLFHKDVPFEYLVKVFQVMKETPRHTYQVLTKRIDRARKDMQRIIDRLGLEGPLCNVWLGATMEDQAMVDHRMADLIQTPAAVRFISVEPLLAGIQLGLAGTVPESWGVGYRTLGTLIDWVIVGGESGQRARRCEVEWVRTIRDQCVGMGVPFMFKQWGAWRPTSAGDEWRYFKVGKHEAGRKLDGKVWDQYPEEAPQ